MNFSKVRLVLFSALPILGLTACNGNNNKTDKQDVTPAKSMPLTISPLENSPTFPDASLTVKNMTTEMQGKDSVKITFNYAVSNYELKGQTSDAAGKGCANSKDGQHIHFILDNRPYAALYEPTHSFTVAVNSKHYVMSFLSRSYHESLKTPKAGVLKYFSVDGKGKIKDLDIPKTPMLFYSRPKGDYLGKDAEKVMLDFYVYNATIGTDANVKATIDGTDFVLDKWQPYFILNAPMGDLNIKLQLVNNLGKAFEGDNTTVSRTAHLAKEEPIK